jgi:hypothetical protein
MATIVNVPRTANRAFLRLLIQRVAEREATARST